MAADEVVAKKWKKCASEGGTCKFAGKKQVRFGAKGKYAYKVFAGSVSCTNGKFGDPNKGARKACYVNTAAVPDLKKSKKQSRKKPKKASKKKQSSKKIVQGRTVRSLKKTQKWV